MKLLLGDCVQKLRDLPVESVDSVVTDPPYDLTAGKRGGSGIKSVNLDSPYGRSRIGTGNGGFMGKDWDSTGVAFLPATWAEALRSLKPGGHLVAFGGPRTYHRMVCAIEDAGFEIRDCLMWVYGQGFPKSLNLDGGLGTALKPAWEPIVLARKPIEGTVEECVTSYGTGALNIDTARVAGETPSVDRREHAVPGESIGATGWVTTARPDSYNKQREGEQLGRWPANLLLSHTSGCVMTGTATAPGRSMNRYTDGVKPFGGGVGHPHESTTLPDEEIEVWECAPGCPVGALGDEARFFYCAKVSQVERNAGCGELEPRFSPTMGNGIGGKEHDPGTATPKQNTHPTVKPIDLMRYLVRLVTPVGGTVLDPFMGSGTTGIAAHLEGRKFIGVEQSEEYMRIAKKRIKFWEEHGEAALVVADAEQARERIKGSGQLDLMDML